MKNVEAYITKTLGIEAVIEKAGNSITGKLPMYLTASNKFYKLNMLEREFLLLYIPDAENLPTAAQAKKWAKMIYETLRQIPVFVVNNLPAIVRARYMEQKINFIVPQSQLFMPWVLMDLKEQVLIPETKKDKLTIAAQYLLLAYLLSVEPKNDFEGAKIFDKPLKEMSYLEIAQALFVPQMTISRAIEDLEKHQLCRTTGVDQNI